MKPALIKQFLLRHWKRMFLVAFLLGFQPACQTESTKENKAAHQSKETDMHPDEEHEHFPPHWPESVFRASNRLVELSSLGDSAKPFEVSLEREFVDLIRWLPDLVADSDLSEVEFNRIDAWSSRYSDLLEKQLAKRSTLSSLLQTDGLAKKIEELADACRVESERRQALE